MSHDSQAALRRIKILHTAIWAVFASCIVAIPFFTAGGHLAVSFGLIAVVAVEVIVLLLNGMKCPLTGIAAHHTADRQDNFDIYLPVLLARYNKQVFGTLYAAGLLYTLVVWRIGKAA